MILEYRGKFTKFIKNGIKPPGYKKITFEDSVLKIKLLDEAKKPDDMAGCNDWKPLNKEGKKWKDCYQIRISPTGDTIRLRYKMKKGQKNVEWVEINPKGWK